MITAHLLTDYLVLPENFEWDWIRFSQILFFDKLVDCVIPQITFPDDENGHNRAVLNQPNRFTLVRKNVKKYEGLELRSNGHCFFRGTLVLKEGFTGSVYGAAGKLAELNQDKLITQYSLPEVEFENKTNYLPGTDTYCCPEMKNQQFFAGIGKTKSEPYTDNSGNKFEETIIQHKHRNIGYSINSQVEGGILIEDGFLYFSDNDEETYRLTVISPQLFLFGLVELLLKENGLYIRSNELSTDTDFISLSVYNSVDINSGSLRSFDPRDSGLIIETKNGEAIVFGFTPDDVSADRAITTFKYSDIIPPVSIKEFLIGIQNLLNVAFVFNDDSTYSIIDRDKVLTGGATNIDNYFSGQWNLGEKKNITLKFIQKHDGDDAMFGDCYIDLTDRMANFGPDVATLAELQTTIGNFQGELRRVLDVQRIFEWRYTPITHQDGSTTEQDAIAWIIISVDFQPGLVNYSPEKEVEEITTCFSTCSNLSSPIVQQLGITSLRKKSEAKFSPRLLFYRGDGWGSNHTDNYMLKFTGENNLIDTRWKIFAPWWANRLAVTGYAHFPENFLKNLNINKKFSTREGEVMPLQITTKIKNSGLGETKIDGFKVE